MKNPQQSDLTLDGYQFRTTRYEDENGVINNRVEGPIEYQGRLEPARPEDHGVFLGETDKDAMLAATKHMQSIVAARKRSQA